MSESPLSDLAVRAARAEIERDEALKKLAEAQESLRAFAMNDDESILDTLHIPAREVRDIYSVVTEWRAKGGTPRMLELITENHRLRTHSHEGVDGCPGCTEATRG